MEIWLDTTDFEFIHLAKELGIVHGVTTNPSLVAACSYKFDELLDHLLTKQDGPVAAQVVADSASEMKEQGERLHAQSPRIIVKVPVTMEGIQAIQYLSEKGVPVMATAIFAPHQALFAFKAGAQYLALYLGRIADMGDNPFEILSQIQNIQRNYNYEGKLLAAGIREASVITTCTNMGIEAVTFNRKIFRQLTEEHPGTLQAVQGFSKDWKQKAMNDE